MQVPFSDKLTISEKTLPFISELSESIPGGFFVYQAYDMQELVFFNSTLASLYGCKGSEEFRAMTGNSFRGMVHPDDYDEVDGSIWGQILDSDNNINHVKFRFLRKDGSQGVLDIYGHFSHSESYGDIFYVFAQDITKQFSEENERQQNNARLLALEDNFEALYDIDLDTGSYEAYINGKALGDVHRKFQNTNSFFADCVKNIENTVVPEDKKSMFGALKRDYIRETLDKGKRFDRYYRQILDGKPVWARMRILYKDADKRNIILGIFNAEEEMAAKTQADKRRNELIRKMAGGESAYIVDTDTEKFRILSQNAYLTGKYPADESYTDSITRYVENDVFETDRKMVSEAVRLPEIIRRLDTEKEYIVRYRDISSGVPRWYEMRAVRLSDNEILYGYTDKDSEILLESFDGMVRKDAYAIFAVDLDSGILKVLKKSPWDAAYESGDTIPYPNVMYRIAEKHTGETKAFYTRLGDVDYVKKAMTEEDKHSYSYRSSFVEGDKWVTVTSYVTAKHEDGTPSIFVLSFTILDAQETSRQKLNARLRGDMQVIGSLADEYTALYHVSLDTGEYITYHLTDMTEDIREYHARFPKFAGLAHVFAESQLVEPEYREKLKAFYPSDEEVKRALEGRKKVSMLFKRNYGGKFLWTEVSIIKCEETAKEAHNVIVGFIEKDAEVRRDLEAAKQRREAEEFDRIVANFTSEYNIVYVVNMEDDTLDIRKMDENMAEKGQNFKSFTEAKNYMLEYVVHPRSREDMRYELDFDIIRKKLSETPSYSFEYTILKDGITYWSEMTVTSFGTDRVVFGMSELDAAIAKRRLEGMRYDEYFALLIVDLDTEKIRPVITTPLFDMPEAGQSVPYAPAIRKFADEHEGEAKVFFNRISDLSYLRSEFAEDNKRTFTYKTTNLAQDQWIDVTSYVIERHKDGSPAVFTIGFSVADALATSRRELQTRLKEDMEIIGGLANGYHALYYFNIKENVFKIYSIDGKRVSELNPIVGKGGDPLEAFRKFGMSDLVHPDDRHLFAEMDVPAVVTKLAHRKKYNVRFRRNMDGNYLWTEMEFIKNEEPDEPANAIAVGFAERDAEIRSEQAIANCFQILGSVIPPEEAIEKLLQTAGEFYGSDRAYIFEYTKDRELIWNTFEWCAQDVEPMKEKLQSVPADEIGGWVRKFRKYGVFFADTLDTYDTYSTPEGRELLEMQGIESLIAVPIMNGDEIVGSVGVDNPKKAKANATVLKNIAAVAYSEILRMKENNE